MPSKDFLALNPGFNAADMPLANRRRGKKRSAANLPVPERAKSGEGDRVPDLMTLAAHGWVRTNYDHRTGEHFMSRQDGTHSPRVSSYRAMLDTMLKGEIQ